MKTKISLYLGLIIFTLGATKMAEAQEGSTTFTNGITVAIRTEATPPLPESASTGISTSETSSSADGKNIIHRVLTDTKNKLYFGYDLEVSASTEKEKFKVAFKPLSINPQKLAKIENLTAFSFNKYPQEMTVGDGDIIFFDTLENPQTKVKFSDLIKITRHGRRFGSYFAERKTAKDFTIDDVEMQAANLEVFINEQKVAQVGGIVGNALSFYAQDKGYFVMSLFPKSGFNLQKIGVVEDNKLSFIYKGENYKFVSSVPFVGTGGKWNVWVYHSSDYHPSYKAQYIFGAGAIDGMLMKKR